MLDIVFAVRRFCSFLFHSVGGVPSGQTVFQRVTAGICAVLGLAASHNVMAAGAVPIFAERARAG